MKKLLFVLLLTGVLQAQVISKWVKPFYSASTKAPITGGAFYAVPYDSTYPAGRVAMTHKGNGVWEAVVNIGTYKIYYNDALLSNYARIWIGEEEATEATKGYLAEINDETDRILLNKYETAETDLQTAWNDNADKIDSAVKYFDPVYFEVNGDTVTATDEWNLIDTNNYPVLDSVYNHTGTASTTASIYRADERIKALKEDVSNKVTSISGSSTDTQYPSAKLLYDQLGLKLNLSGGTLTGTLTGTTINATTGFTLGGTSINTTGTLTNVAYKGQNNNFTVGQTITGNSDITGTFTISSDLIFTNSVNIRQGTSDGTDNKFIKFTGGGISSLSRGAVLILSGNEETTYLGSAVLNAGGGSDQFVKIGNNTLCVDQGNGRVGVKTATPSEALEVTGNIKASGTVTSTQFKLSALNTAPANASATGTTGEIRIVDGFIYICTATNTWKRVAIATW